VTISQDKGRNQKKGIKTKGAEGQKRDNSREKEIKHTSFGKEKGPAGVSPNKGLELRKRHLTRECGTFKKRATTMGVDRQKRGCRKKDKA